MVLFDTFSIIFETLSTFPLSTTPPKALLTQLIAFTNLPVMASLALLIRLITGLSLSLIVLIRGLRALNILVRFSILFVSIFSPSLAKAAFKFANEPVYNSFAPKAELI